MTSIIDNRASDFNDPATMSADRLGNHLSNPGGLTMGELHRLAASRVSFGLQAAGRLLTEIFPIWVQDLALLVESVETVRPPGAPPDWQPGAIVRLPFCKRICSDGVVVCSQALMAPIRPWSWPVRPRGTAIGR